MRTSYVAAAVATALGSVYGTDASAAGPFPAQASAATHRIFIAGSSSAASAVLSAIALNTCGGSNYSIFSTPPSAPDFRAVSCTAAAGQPFAGTSITVWYRAEADSFVGIQPLYNNISVKFLDIANAGCTATDGVHYACNNITGTPAVNGTNDTWGGAVITHSIDFGISDLEPGAFGSDVTPGWAGGSLNNASSNYSPSFRGPANPSSQILQSALHHSVVFEQTFGFVVSTNLGFTDLPKEQVAAIFDGFAGDWSEVMTSANMPASSGSVAVCHQVVGSGARAATDLFLNQPGCVAHAPTNTIGNTDLGVGNATHSTAELACVNSQPNAIGYVAVNELSQIGPGTAFPNVKAISVSGIAATRQNSALGVYGNVYEATLNLNASLSTDANVYQVPLRAMLQGVGKLPGDPGSAQVTAVPGLPSGLPLPASAFNDQTGPLQVGPNGAITSQFFRNGGAGNSCTPLTF
ncbi:MAG TPA: hypothetical protein VGC34_01565 [Steroidobacteraceae bacterium]